MNETPAMKPLRSLILEAEEVKPKVKMSSLL